MPGNISRQNGKKGGRPKGKKNEATLEREAVKKTFDQRILRMTDSLINAQAVLAVGQTFLYRIDKEWIKTGTNKKGGDNGYWRNKKPVQVTDQWEIEDYLVRMADKANGDAEDTSDPSAAYYFMTAKEPNNMAIDSMHNRVHGKPKEAVELSNPDGNLKTIIIQKSRGRNDDN